MKTYQIKYLDEFRCGTDQFDLRGLRLIASATPSWAEAKRDFWRFVKMNRRDLRKGSGFVKGIVLCDNQGKELYAETTENLGELSYASITKPK